MLKYLKKKNDFVERVWPTNLALFVSGMTNYVETAKWFDFDLFVQLTRWPRCFTPDCSVRGPGLNSRLWQGFFICFVIFFIFLKSIPGVASICFLEVLLAVYVHQSDTKPLFTSHWILYLRSDDCSSVMLTRVQNTNRTWVNYQLVSLIRS